MPQKIENSAYTARCTDYTANTDVKERRNKQAIACSAVPLKKYKVLFKSQKEENEEKNDKFIYEDYSLFLTLKYHWHSSSCSYLIFLTFSLSNAPKA